MCVRMCQVCQDGFWVVEWGFLLLTCLTHADTGFGMVCVSSEVIHFW